MPDDIDTLKDDIADLHRGRGKKYPPELRDEIISTARMLRDGGWTWAAISEALGLSVKALRSLMKRWGRPPQGDAMRPVTVAERADRTAEARGLRIVSPHGWRIEGLTVDDAAALLAKLPC